jgi:hypothetical protein
MTPDTLNLVTKWVIIGPWVVFALWEVALLVLRQKVGTDVKTISMQAKDLGAGGLTALVYFWFGLGSHYWITWTRPTWDFPWLGILFWAFGVAFLAVDIFTHWNAALWPEWMRWVRYTPLVAAFGVLCGWALFPQRSGWTP